MTKTKWKIVALDETMYWSEAIVGKAGRLYGLYLFDANRHVHCCDMSPSYELFPYDVVITDNWQDEELQQDVQEGWSTGTNSVSYYYCRDIDKMNAKWFHEFPEHDTTYTTEEEWEEQLEEMLEMLRGNAYCPDGVECEQEEA